MESLRRCAFLFSLATVAWTLNLEREVEALLQEKSSYNDLLTQTVGTLSGAKLEFQVAQRLRSILGAQNILSMADGMVVFRHDGFAENGGLAGVHEDLGRVGFQPYRMMGKHSIYKQMPPEGAASVASAEREAAPVNLRMVHKLPPRKKGLLNLVKTPPRVAVCMTTIPSHLRSDKGFNVTVESLSSLVLEQDYSDSQITAYLTISKAPAVREKSDYPVERLAGLTERFGDKLVIVTIDHDVGPASRYVGCAEALKERPDDYVIGFDDDIAYEANAISTLVCAKKMDPSSTWTGHSFFGVNNKSVGQGADGLIFQVRDLGGTLEQPSSYSNLMEKVGKGCFKVDDLSISDFLTQKGLPVKTLEDKKQHPSCGYPDLPIYKKNCWTEGPRNWRRCRPTIRGENSLRTDHESGGRGKDMYRCADALLQARGEVPVYTHEHETIG